MNPGETDGFQHKDLLDGSNGSYQKDSEVHILTDDSRGTNPLFRSSLHDKDVSIFGGLESKRRKAIPIFVALLVTATLSLITLIVGIIFLVNYNTYDSYEIVKDYTNCGETSQEIRCKDSLNSTGKKCTCYIEVEITRLMKEPVTVFYELDSYDQITSSYAQSRDDNQLAGNLSPEPSASCGAYTYANSATKTKPIAPCGGLADAMFNDTFTLQTNNEYIPSLDKDLISEDDKRQFHNPPGNLSQAFEKFSKPINWRKNVWELDTNNPENNGFRNEAFIIWMKTDLKRKPAWRVNHTGVYEHGVIPGNYTLRVIYGYPPSRYDGPRKFIIRSGNLVNYIIGVTLLVISLLCFVLFLVEYYYFREDLSGETLRSIFKI